MSSTVPKRHSRRSSRQGREKPSPPPKRYHSMSSQSMNQRERLREVARDTIELIPELLGSLGKEKDAKAVYKIRPGERLKPLLTPLHPEPATIKVINDDTLNAAIPLAYCISPEEQQEHNPRPAILNFADSHRPGGGWRNGAMAQEEAICYRSSLNCSITANPNYYPLHDGILYSPYVLVAKDANHQRLSGHARTLPTVSVLSVAAIRKPPVKKWEVQGFNPTGVRMKYGFARDKERDRTKLKMRLCLRTAAEHGHTVLVLGALGCGVYENPPEDVAHCWLEVLKEAEFWGNRWRKICFAVLDSRNEGIYDIFSHVLDGKKV
ncbi:hypothetical protein DL768_010320 [Monosporascus sp. mg162]|nr:hypothetical protein DL768_010320 [Monosporascus sp. mg162]